MLERNKHLNKMEKVFKQFREVTKDPHEFLSLQTNRVQKIQQLLNGLYSNNINNVERKQNPNILSELFLDGMDEEQIWQQIELWNDSVWPKYVEESSKYLSRNNEHFELKLEDDEDDNYVDNEDLEPGDEIENTDFSDADEIDSEEMEEEQLEDKNRKQYKKTIVDDKFFKLREMEEFLNAEDKKEELKHDGKQNLDGKIDYFNDDLSDEDEENVNYKDFFAEDGPEDTENNSYKTPSNKKLIKRNEDEQDDEDLKEEESFNSNEQDQNNENYDNESYVNETEEEDEVANKSEDGHLSENESSNEVEQVKSSFEMRQERLKKRIEEYEEEALSEKPWQLKGEILATGRPQNALLEEVLQFDATARPPPVITEETTLRLEDIIRLRIKDKAWDDVERKAKPVKTAQEFRKEIVLNQEKSKESLAQIYEKDYQKELDKLNPDREANEEEPKAHKEIKEMMKELFSKLDALSNFHYTPKPVAPEPKIITNTPAVNMEEVAPLAMTDAKLLAPEEVKNRLKGEVVGKSERTRTDKNRERRKKKTRQRAIYKAKEENHPKKQEMGIKLSSKEEKGKMMRQLLKNKNVEKMQENKTEGKAIKSSTTFFSHLQDKAFKGRKTKAPIKANSLSAKKLKL